MPLENRIEAIVLIEAGGQNALRLAESLVKVNGIEEAWAVYGQQDVVARVVARNSLELKKLVIDTIQEWGPLPEKTWTYILIEGGHFISDQLRNTKEKLPEETER